MIMMSEPAVLCESDKQINENRYAGAVRDLEFGSDNLEGDVSNPSFSTDVSDEEGTVYFALTSLIADVAVG